MNRREPCALRFGRLTEVPPDQIAAHLSQVRLRRHMPLLKGQWDRERVAAFVDEKEAAWRRDGLGHWAVFHDGAYVGWGGFQKHGEDWDYGLVLRSGSFGLGGGITRRALAWARADPRIPYVTFLLAPSRKAVGALSRLGAQCVGPVDHDGETFVKYRLDLA